ncbi:MAG: hypothetical protein GX605_10350 [Chloroflexi bacterium]|nr:hypothetical protein [Chloroflexota bacterium]
MKFVWVSGMVCCSSNGISTWGCWVVSMGEVPQKPKAAVGGIPGVSIPGSFWAMM